MFPRGAWGLTEWFDEYENDVNLNTCGGFQSDVLALSATIIKTPNEEDMFMEGWRSPVHLLSKYVELSWNALAAFSWCEKLSLDRHMGERDVSWRWEAV